MRKNIKFASIRTQESVFGERYAEPLIMKGGAQLRRFDTPLTGNGNSLLFCLQVGKNGWYKLLKYYP